MMNPYKLTYEEFLVEADRRGDVWLLAYSHFWLTIRDPEWVDYITSEVLENSPKAISQYRKPKKREKTLSFLMGQVMKRTSTIDPEDCRASLVSKLDGSSPCLR